MSLFPPIEPYNDLFIKVSDWELHQAWPEAEFHIIKDSGHSMTEPGIAEKLVQLTEYFADL